MNGQITGKERENQRFCVVLQRLLKYFEQAGGTIREDLFHVAFYKQLVDDRATDRRVLDVILARRAAGLFVEGVLVNRCAIRPTQSAHPRNGAADPRR